MKSDSPAVVMERIEERIHTVRGQRVMLDADLAAVYGVITKALNQAVKRNRDKFPADFAFQLTGDEVVALRSQVVTSKRRGGRRYLPYAFTEHGAIMAATVLNSPQAVQMSVFVVRAFIKMRAALSDIYLVRNEGHFKICNFSDGQAFEPDFVLFLREKTGKVLTYQVFIEPKGQHLKAHDKWKETFLKEIREEFADKVLKFDGDTKYRLIGVPFYNNEDENVFKETLQSVL